MKSKVCGIPTFEVAERVISLKPDAIGIYCWDDEEKGRNLTDFETASQIVALASSHLIDTFYLTYSTTAADVVQDCQVIGNSHIQLLGDISLTEIHKVKAALPDLIIVKVIGVTGENSVREALSFSNDDAVDQVLLDSRSGNVRGGTGKTHDWAISRQIVEASKKPVWLAGGIRLLNLQDAMSLVSPYGIDVETGVQNMDGSKDYAAIKEFIERVHGFKT